MREWTLDDMKARLVRYADLIPCRTAFIDSRTPGSTEKENFTIIGAGVSESPDQHVHITEKHGFNIGAARQPFGCVNSQHSHDTAEVFLVHSGRWRLTFGPNREDGGLEIGPGDVASIPIHMYRGFEKVDPGVGFLWTVLGEDDPGRVTWAPAVFEAAADHGLKLTRAGRLIDTSTGSYDLAETALEDVAGPAPAREDLATPPADKLRQCLAPFDSLIANPASPLAADGVEEAGVVGPARTDDGFEAGPIAGWWPHGFNLRRLTLRSGAYVPMHARREAEVLFVHQGALEVSWAGGELILAPGDTLTLPIGLERALRNTASIDCVAFVVRGSDSPAAPLFATRPATAG